SNASYGVGGITSSFNGHTQISGAPGSASGFSFDETIPGTVDKVLGGTAYFIYAQACPPGVGANGAGCSNWIRLKSGIISTDPLPTTPLKTRVKADENTNSIVVRGQVVAPANVQNWHMQLKNVQASGPMNDLGLRSYNLSQSITIGPSASYNSTLLP